MSARRTLVAALLAPVTILSLAVTPAEDARCHQIRGVETPNDLDDDVEVCEAETWFHQGTTKLGNLGATAVDSYPTFDDNEPGSYEAGNGAGYAALLGDLVASDRNQPRFDGSFTGPLDTMHVTAYVASPLYEAFVGSFPLEFTLVIDGIPVMIYEPDPGEEKQVPLFPHQGCDVPEVGIICSEMKFAITNLYDAMELNALDVSPGVEHTISLHMNAVYFGDTQSVFLYDAAEVPAGIDFNTVDAFSLVTYDAVIGS